MNLYANRYEPVRVLGSGAFGRVLCVRDTKTDKQRALKLIVQNSIHANQTLKNEFAILQNLTHPNLANVLEMGQITENSQIQWFLVSELIVGQDVFTWSKSATQADIDKIFYQLLHTLHFLHEHNICHGDLKTQNILIENQSGTAQLKLIDFGLAQNIKSANSTQAGTAIYMAPEMFQGITANLQTDIYAAGLVMYKILTRNLPDSNQEFVPPTAWNPTLPAHYNVVLKKMLQAQPENRYHSMQEILEDCQLLQDIPTEAASEAQDELPFSFEPFFLRAKEKKIFLDFYQDRLFGEKNTHPPITVIVGEAGVGKSHFVADICKIAAQDLIPVFTWSEWQKQTSFEDLPRKALVCADDAELDEETTHYLTTFFSDAKLLFVFTAQQFDAEAGVANQIQLAPWSDSQTTQYLQHVIGQAHLPKTFVDVLFAKTKGLPSAVHHSVQTLLQKKLLRTDIGKWSQKVLDDLQNQLIFDLPVLDGIQTQKITADDRRELQNVLGISEAEIKSDDYFLYAKLKRREQQNHKALEILDWLLQNTELKLALRTKAILEAAEINIELNRLETAKKPLQLLLSQIELPADDHIRALELLGVCEFRNQKLNAACEIFADALTKLGTLKTANAALTVSIQSRLSLVKWRLGDSAVAEELNDAAWQIFQNELTPSEKLATVRLNIDEIYYQKGLYQKALDCLNEYYQLLAAEPFREAYPITLYKMARVHLQMRDWALAEFKLNLCLQEFKNRNSLQWLAYVYNELGILSKKKGLLDAALQHYQHAFELQRLFKKDESLFLIAQNLGNLHLAKQSFAEAEKYFSYAHKNLLKMPESTLVRKGLLDCEAGLALAKAKNLANSSF